MSELAIEVGGSGEPVVFIHGLGGTSNVFGPQVAVLQRFFSCIRPDLPGAGRSPARGSVSIESLAQDILGTLDETVPGAPVHLVAHSMGTLIARYLAHGYPDRVRTLSLIGPIPVPTEATRQALRERAVKAREQGLQALADAIVLGGTSANTRGCSPVVAAFVRELIMRQTPQGYALHCEALAGAKEPESSAISQRALLITGDEDGTASPWAALALANESADAKLVLLSQCGHWASLERPKEVTHALLEFLLGQRRLS